MKKGKKVIGGFGNTRSLSRVISSIIRELEGRNINVTSSNPKKVKFEFHGDTYIIVPDRERHLHLETKEGDIVNSYSGRHESSFNYVPEQLCKDIQQHVFKLIQKYQ